MKNRIIFLPIVLFLMILFSEQKGFTEVHEYELKAAFIAKFTGFITWPDSDYITDFKICVIGVNPFGKSLEKTFQNKNIQNKKVILKNIIDTEEIPANCRILFISSSSKKKLDDILKKADLRNTLIIGDTEGYCEKGVLLNFYKENNNIKFEVNKSVLDKSNIKFSYKLLTLAKII